jgi:hypothetical protein
MRPEPIPKLQRGRIWEVCSFCLGYPEQALARSNAAIAEARRLAHPPSLVVGLSIGNRLLSLVGYHSALGGLADDLITVAAQQSFTFWSAPGTIAEEQAAKFWELRAATSIARLWADCGRRSEARHLLAQIYG